MSKVHICGAEKVMDWYDRNVTTPFYSVWQGRQLLGSYNTEDENGRDKLSESLLAFEQNGIGDVMTIKLHPAMDKNGFITDKTPVYASLNFRAIDVDGLTAPVRNSLAGNEVRYSPTVTAMLQESLEVNKKLLAYLEEDDDEPDNSTENILAGLLTDPTVKTLLVGMIGKFLNPNMPAQPQAMAGIVGKEDIELLQNLMQRGITTDHLKKIAAMDDQKLHSLLIML